MKKILYKKKSQNKVDSRFLKYPRPTNPFTEPLPGRGTGSIFPVAGGSIPPARGSIGVGVRGTPRGSWEGVKGRFLEARSDPKSGKKSGIIHIKCTKNNTIYTLTDLHGNTCGWISAGSVGYRHSRKTSHPASQKSGREILSLTKKHGYNSIILKVKGLTRRKKGFIRPLLSKRVYSTVKQGRGRIFFEKIVNGQSIPFNGCRSPVQRRK